MRHPRRKRLFTIGAWLGLLAVFPSCLETKNPVTDAQQGGRDKALCGAWKYREKDGTLWLLQFGFLQGELKSPWMVCTFSTNSGTDHGAATTACFVSSIDGIGYLNLANGIEMTTDELAADAKLLDKVQGFTVLKFAVKDGKLFITTAADRFVENAVKKGLIEGQGATISASSAALASFLEREHQQVFPAKNTVEFTRL